MDAPAPSEVLGLAETGNAQDADRLEDFLSDGSASLRHAAIRGLVAVTPGTHVDAICAALGDASAKVSHAARDAILTSSAPFRIAHLETLAKKVGSLHSRKNALRVLAQTPGWDALAPLLSFGLPRWRRTEVWACRPCTLVGTSVFSTDQVSGLGDRFRVGIRASGLASPKTQIH